MVMNRKPSSFNIKTTLQLTWLLVLCGGQPCTAPRNQVAQTKAEFEAAIHKLLFNGADIHDEQSGVMVMKCWRPHSIDRSHFIGDITHLRVEGQPLENKSSVRMVSLPNSGTTDLENAENRLYFVRKIQEKQKDDLLSSPNMTLDFFVARLHIQRWVTTQRMLDATLAHGATPPSVALGYKPSAWLATTELQCETATHYVWLDEFLPGGTFHKLAFTLQEAGIGFSFTQRCFLFAEAIAALGALHAVGKNSGVVLIHTDAWELKNWLLKADGHLALIDYESTFYPEKAEHTLATLPEMGGEDIQKMIDRWNTGYCGMQRWMLYTRTMPNINHNRDWEDVAMAFTALLPKEFVDFRKAHPSENCKKSDWMASVWSLYTHLADRWPDFFSQWDVQDDFMTLLQSKPNPPPTADQLLDDEYFEMCYDEMKSAQLFDTTRITSFKAWQEAVRRQEMDAPFRPVVWNASSGEFEHLKPGSNGHFTHYMSQFDRPKPIPIPKAVEKSESPK